MKPTKNYTQSQIKSALSILAKSKNRTFEIILIKDVVSAIQNGGNHPLKFDTLQILDFIANGKTLPYHLSQNSPPTTPNSNNSIKSMDTFKQHTNKTTSNSIFVSDDMNMCLDYLKEIVGNNVKAIQKIADKTGVSTSKIQKILNGAVTLNIGLWKAILPGVSYLELYPMASA